MPPNISFCEFWYLNILLLLVHIRISLLHKISLIMVMVIPVQNHQRSLLRRSPSFPSPVRGLEVRSKWVLLWHWDMLQYFHRDFTLRHNYLLKQHVLASWLMLLPWQLSLNVLSVSCARLYITVWVLKVHFLSCRKQMSWPLCWRILLLCV